MPDIFDGGWKLFAHDADTGRTIWSQWIDGKITFRVDSPVDHIVAANKAAITADHPYRLGDYVCGRGAAAALPPGGACGGHCATRRPAHFAISQ
jgi:hypothetical protein